MSNNDYFGQDDATWNCSNNDGDDKGDKDNCDDVENGFINYHVYQLGGKSIKQSCNFLKIILVISLLLWCLAIALSRVI